MLVIMLTTLYELLILLFPGPVKLLVVTILMPPSLAFCNEGLKEIE